MVEGRTVLVCGGRDYGDREAVFSLLDGLHKLDPVGTVVHGGARGADALAGEWAVARGVAVAVVQADSQQMLDDHDPVLVVAFPGGTGTADMVSKAAAAGVPVVVVEGRAGE